MFKTIAARYPGTCKRCQGPIEIGSRMRYGGKGRTYHLKAECPAGGNEDGGSSQEVDRVGPAVEFGETARGLVMRERWARGYEALNGAPEGEWDR